MRLLAKPISSPSRVDKFPPPLLRLVSNNGSIRSSRGRSRSSPIFVKQVSITQEPEPSSPKVTCMGQVRARRSKKERRSSKRCKWIPTSLFCHQFDFWGRWNKRKVGGERKAREIQEDEVTAEDEVESQCGFEQDEGERFVFSKPATPPKNALLLMRCSSEPHRDRASFKFWDSPLTEHKLDKDDKEEEPTSQKEGRESRIEAETSRVPANALLLTRCKSEPGRRRGKIEVEACFWKRRFGFVDVSSTRF